MSEFAEDDVEKLSRVPLVHDATHPDHTADDDSAAGALVALHGAPVNGGVPTYSSGTGKHTSQVPGAVAAGPVLDSYAAALRMDADARVREASLGSSTSLTDEQVALLAQFYGA